MRAFIDPQTRQTIHYTCLLQDPDERERILGWAHLNNDKRVDCACKPWDPARIGVMKSSGGRHFLRCLTSERAAHKFDCHYQGEAVDLAKKFFEPGVIEETRDGLLKIRLDGGLGDTNPTVADAARVPVQVRTSETTVVRSPSVKLLGLLIMAPFALWPVLL